MGKHHQSSRRKNYGRRQHELRERLERTHPSDLAEFDLGQEIDERAGYRFPDVQLVRRFGLAMSD